MEDQPHTIDVAYAGRPDGLVFLVGDKRLQHVYIRNSSARERVMFKIQSTSSRTFRVRPGMGVLGAHDSTAVQIQLSPQQQDPCDCKFLLVVRHIDDGTLGAIATPRVPTATSLEAAQQQRDADDKATWLRAEARHQASLVFSETIHARVVRDPVAPPPPCREFRTDEPLRLDSLETRASVVALLMKNQSRLEQNRLTPTEQTALRRLRESLVGGEWQALERDAARLRALVRQYKASRGVQSGPI